MVSPTGAPAGKYYDANTNSYVLDPPGTYSGPGQTAPTPDPGGNYSPAGASNPLLDPMGTYTNNYELNGLFLEWKQTTPSNVELAFNSLTQVQDYYGATSPEASLARRFFGRSYAAAGAVMRFVRIGLGQRPHLIGANVSPAFPTLADLQAVRGTIAITFDGYNYSGHLTLAAVSGNMNDGTAFATAAPLISGALNYGGTGGNQLPIVATTTGTTIVGQSAHFQGYVQPGETSHLFVTSVAPGDTVTPGGIASGSGITPGAQIISQLSSTEPNGALGGTGEYNLFSAKGLGPPPPPVSATTSTAMSESWGVMNVGAVTFGNIRVGQEVQGTDPDIQPLTAVVTDLGGGKWIINRAPTGSVSGNITTTAPPLTVESQFRVGVNGALYDAFEIQPNGFFGYNYNPSQLDYASGTVAQILGLSSDATPDPNTGVGAIDTQFGGLHPTMAQFMNGLANIPDQYGNINGGNFGWVYSTEPRFATALGLWVMAKGLGKQLVTSPRAAGQATPVTDPIGTHSGSGATIPIRDTAPLSAYNVLVPPEQGHFHY